MSHSCPPLFTLTCKHTCPLRSTPTHSRASTYTNTSWVPCHILPLTHSCSHVDTPTVLDSHPQIHLHAYPSLSPLHLCVHTEAQTQINAHSHTEDTWRTYTFPSMYSYTSTPVLTHHYRHLSLMSSSVHANIQEWMYSCTHTWTPKHASLHTCACSCTLTPQGCSNAFSHVG